MPSSATPKIQIVTDIRSRSTASPTDTIASGYSSTMESYHSNEHFPVPDSLPTPTTAFARAVFAFSDPDPAILSFTANDILEVISRDPSGWWDCMAGSSWNGYGIGGEVRRGWVPSNYLSLLANRDMAKILFIRNAGKRSRL